MAELLPLTRAVFHVDKHKAHFALAEFITSFSKQGDPGEAGNLPATGKLNKDIFSRLNTSDIWKKNLKKLKNSLTR